MSASSVINSIGLLFDIFGVVLIWRYGLPEPVDRTGKIISWVSDNINEAEKAKATRYDRLSHIGLAMIILGFVLQLFSNWL